MPVSQTGENRGSGGVGRVREIFTDIKGAADIGRGLHRHHRDVVTSRDTPLLCCTLSRAGILPSDVSKDASNQP